MTQYDNSGALSKNERQRPGKKDPEYQGQCTIDGRQYWLSAWKKTGPRGGFLSLSFKGKDQQQVRMQDLPQDDDFAF